MSNSTVESPNQVRVVVYDAAQPTGSAPVVERCFDASTLNDTLKAAGSLSPFDPRTVASLAADPEGVLTLRAMTIAAVVYGTEEERQRAAMLLLYIVAHGPEAGRVRASLAEHLAQHGRADLSFVCDHEAKRLEYSVFVNPCLPYTEGSSTGLLAQKVAGHA